VASVEVLRTDKAEILAVLVHFLAVSVEVQPQAVIQVASVNFSETLEAELMEDWEENWANSSAEVIIAVDFSQALQEERREQPVRTLLPRARLPLRIQARRSKYRNLLMVPTLLMAQTLVVVHAQVTLDP